VTAAGYFITKTFREYTAVPPAVTVTPRSVGKPLFYEQPRARGGKKANPQWQKVALVVSGLALRAAACRIPERAASEITVCGLVGPQLLPRGKERLASTEKKNSRRIAAGAQ